MICFLTHQLRTTTRAKDALHHQQQATLSNNGSDISTTWEFARIGWAWRSSSLGAFRRSIGLVSIGVLHLAAFGATGILSSYITTVDNQVLLSESPRCGPWNSNLVNNGSLLDSIGWSTFQSTILLESGHYVQSCLSGAQSQDCDAFKQVELDWTSANVQCPFHDLCLGPTNTTLSMDTGYLDSRDDLGINSNDEDRIQWRQVTTCVPIKTDGYIKSGSSSITYFDFTFRVSSTPVNYTAAFYGKTGINSTSFGFTDPALEYMTYIYTHFNNIATNFYTLGVPLYSMQ